MKEKSLPLAIGLNILLPGVGYMYMGKWIVGIFCCLLVVGIYATTGLLYLVPTWLVLNVVMALDMVILFNKHKKDVEQATTMKCPNCAELIKREARVCRFCNTSLTNE